MITYEKNDLLTRDKLPAYTIIKDGSVGSAKRCIEGVMGK